MLGSHAQEHSDPPPRWAQSKANRDILHASIDERQAGPVGHTSGRIEREIRDLLPLIESRLDGRLRRIAAKRRLTTLAKSSVLLERALGAVEHLEASGIRVVVLKGAALLHRAYDDRIDLRPITDVDLMVAPEDFQRSIRLLRDTGWKVIGAPMIDVKLCFDHGLHFFRAGGSLDLHRRPFPEGDLWGEDGGAMIDRCMPGRILGHPVSIPSPTDLFTHTCIHGIGSLGHEIGARWIVDAGRLIQRYEIDWEGLRKRTEPSGVTFLLGHALRWLTRLGVDLPAEVIAHFPSKPTQPRERAVEVWRDGVPGIQGPVAWLRRARAVALCTQPAGEQSLDLLRALRLAPAYTRYVLESPTLREVPTAARERLRHRRKRAQRAEQRVQEQ